MIKETILYIIGDSSNTGAPTELLYLCRGLKHDFNIICLCPAGWLVDKLRKEKVRTIEFKNNNSSRAIINQIKYETEKIKPEIVHLHGVRAGIAGRLALNNKKTKIVYTEHLWTSNFHLPSRLREWLQLITLKTLGKKTDYTICVSQAVFDFLFAQKIIKKNNARVIYGAVEPLKISSKKKNDEIVIGTIGRLTWIKGVDLLIKAIKLVTVKYPNIQCIIAGDGPEKNNLENLTKKYLLTKNIKFIGAVKIKEKFFEKIGIYVQPSLSESFGIGVLEAMTMKLPVVAANVGALPEIIIDKKSGLLFNSVEELAENIIYLIENKKKKNEIGLNSYKLAKKYSIEKMTAEHKKLYNKLLDKNDKKN